MHIDFRHAHLTAGPWAIQPSARDHAIEALLRPHAARRPSPGPIAAGILAEGKTWTHKGPFNLGGISKLVAVLAVLGGAVLVFAGIQPPNEKVLYVTIAMLVVMALFWFVFGERNRFKGPPAVKE